MTSIQDVQGSKGSGANFSSVPILDYSLLSSPTTRPQFILQLRHALINVGFLYLSNHPVPAETINSLTSYIPRLFALPQHEKDKIAMANSPQFLGYSKLGDELTKGKVDWREQFDFATPHVCRWKEGVTPKEEGYLRLWGPSQVFQPLLFHFRIPNHTHICEIQWPEESLIPGFRTTVEQYLSQAQALSYEFSSLLAEAFSISPDAVAQFYDVDDNMQHRVKLVRYPVRVAQGIDDAEAQGVGPHYDAGFLTFVSCSSFPSPGVLVWFY